VNGFNVFSVGDGPRLARGGQEARGRGEARGGGGVGDGSRAAVPRHGPLGFGKVDAKLVKRQLHMLARGCAGKDESIFYHPQIFMGINGEGPKVGDILVGGAIRKGKMGGINGNITSVRVCASVTSSGVTSKEHAVGDGVPVDLTRVEPRRRTSACFASPGSLKQGIQRGVVGRG